jgi:hypothetical protein
VVVGIQGPGSPVVGDMVKKQLRSHGEVVSIHIGAKDSKQYSTLRQSALLPKWNLTVDDRDCVRLAVSAEVLSTRAGDKG